jgi:site-specific DNA-methyltransferase (adenine-specific)
MSKKKYKPGLARLKFKPDHDWTIQEAQSLFEARKFPFQIDHIHFQDCISGMQTLPENSIDLIIADPPFGIDFDKMGSQYNRDSSLVTEGYQEVNDNYSSFTYNWMKQLPRIMKETSSAYIFSGWTNLGDLLNSVKKLNLTLINHIIWKYQFGVFTKNKFVTSHYHILFLVKNEQKYFFNKIEHYPLDVWQIKRKYRPGQQKNSTKLPEKVVNRCINYSSKPGDLILDPFMGNGTTAVCAKTNFRHFLGFEINKNAEEIIKSNLSRVEIGESYRPYYTFLPSPEELAKKYPAVKKYLEDKNKEKQFKDLRDFIQ